MNKVVNMHFFNDLEKVDVRKKICNKYKVVVIILSNPDFEIIKETCWKKINKAVKYLRWRRGKNRVSLINIEKFDV
jgi:hypothetical protein